MELLSKQNKNFSETSFCHDFREFLENSKILRPFSKHFEKKHKFEMKKTGSGPPPLKHTFFVQNRLKVGWAPYRSHEITCIFSKYKKSLKAKTLEENIVILWWKLLFRRDVCLFESSIILVSNWHIFWIFWNLLQVHNINIFIQRPNSHVLKINSTGGLL